MIEDLKTIYEGKATVIKNKQYLSTKEYVEPFIEHLSKYTNKFICNVKLAEQLSSDSDEVNLVYNKVLITAIFPKEYDIVLDETYHRVVNMSYGLDVKRPMCKFYTGVINDKGIFYAFGSDCINMQEIEPEEAINYTFIEPVIKNGLNDNCELMLKQFPSLSYMKDSLTEILGEWIDFTLKKEYINDSGKIKLSSVFAIDAYKSLALDKDSDFYGEENRIPINSVYQAFASQVNKDDKDLLNRYEKIQLINQMLKL